MSQTPATAEFDYASLDEDTAGKLEYFAGQGKSLIRKSQIRFIADFGQILSEARKVLANYGDGTFRKWATSEFDLSHQTVYNYVNAWDRCLSNGLTNLDNLSPTAIYLLTSDSTPSEVQAKVKRLASSKTTVTKADIQRLIESNGASKPTAGKTEKSGNGKPSKTETAGSDGTDNPNSGPPAQESQTGTDSASVAPNAEPANGKEPWRVERSRAKKTTEALMRSLGDLNDLRPITFLAQSLEDCRAIIAELDAMK